MPRLPLSFAYRPGSPIYIWAAHWTVRCASTFQTIAKCPSPTCACQPTPPNLDIDQEHDLNGSIGAYSRQVIVFTAKNDWKSRFEEDGEQTGWGDLTRKLKKMTTRGGTYADPYNNILITASSFSTSDTRTQTGASALVFPDSVLIHDIRTNSSEDFEIKSLIEDHLIPKPHPNPHLPPDATTSSCAIPSIPITSPTILICGHGGRDQRCGIIGPILKTEFETHLERMGLRPPPSSPPQLHWPTPNSNPNIQVGLISHIGGHKFAGNVIIYFPPNYTNPPLSSEKHPLAGKGIWYGRIEPRHVEGIITETIGKGTVIKEHFRGGVGITEEDGVGGRSEVLRLPLELKAKKWW